MSKINVIKFVPYFPPHKGGLESHVQERSQWWVKKGYGEVINVVTPMGQEKIMQNSEFRIQNGIESIVHKDQIIGYTMEGYQVVVLDAFDLIPVFPFPKFRTKKFWTTISYLKSQIKNYGKQHTLVNTHTRFFLTSLMGGIFAKYMGIKWVHIEHGVDFVKLASKFKSMIAYIYDQTIGRYVFRNADMVVGISAGCQRFANKFSNKKIPVIHRGMNFTGMQNAEFKIQKGEKKNIVIGFVGRLVKLKGLDLLVEAFDNLYKRHKNLTLEIVGDGDQLDELQTLVKDLGLDGKVSFLGFKDREYVANEFLPHVDIVVNPSYQEGLPTSVLEGLLSKCVVVATSVGGTPEISDQKDLILVDKGSVSDLQKGLEYAIQNHEKLKGLSYDYVKEHFDWKRSIEKYHEVYKNFII